jgi:hypothetical protein
MAARIFFLTAVLALPLVAALPVGLAQSQELEWAKSAGGSSTDIGFGIAADPRGNSYVTGFFTGTAAFGAGEANETELTSEAATAVFIAKHAPDGSLLWAKSGGGTEARVWGRSIAVDFRGNSYVTGSFMGTAIFGAGEANETELTALGGQDVFFVAKYAPDGSLLWITSAGGTEAPVSGRGIALDPRGNSYVTGSFRGTTTFGGGEANETELTALGQGVFVAKYALDGSLLWITSAGGTEAPVSGRGIALDPHGNSYVTGSFRGTATFGAGEANETELTALGQGVFVAKYAPDGSLLWARSAGGSRFDSGTGIAADPRGNSYVTGDLSSDPAIFGVGEPNETETGKGIFVAKYAPNGRLLWVRSGGYVPPEPSEPPLWEYGGVDGSGIATDARGNSYVTGMLYSRIAIFGAGETSETIVGGGIFIAKYAHDGVLIWVTSAGRPDSARSWDIAVDPHGSSYVTGDFWDNLRLGVGQANETELINRTTDNSVSDIFVAKFADGHGQERRR